MKCSQGRLAGLGRGRWQDPSSGTLGTQLSSGHGPEQKLPVVANSLVGQNAHYYSPICLPLGLDCLVILLVYLCNIPDRMEMLIAYFFTWEAAIMELRPTLPKALQSLHKWPQKARKYLSGLGT